MLDKISLALDMENRRKHKDFNQLAKSIVDIVTGESDSDKSNDVIGRQGGLLGGKARAEKLTPERRKEIAQKAAGKRWGN